MIYCQKCCHEVVEVEDPCVREHGCRCTWISPILPNVVKIFKVRVGWGLCAITVGDIDAAEIISLTGASWYRSCRTHLHRRQGLL